MCVYICIHTCNTYSAVFSFDKISVRDGSSLQPVDEKDDVKEMGWNVSHLSCSCSCFAVYIDFFFLETQNLVGWLTELEFVCKYLFLLAYLCYNGYYLGILQSLVFQSRLSPEDNLHVCHRIARRQHCLPSPSFSPHCHHCSVWSSTFIPGINSLLRNASAQIRPADEKHFNVPANFWEISLLLENLFSMFLIYVINQRITGVIH